MVGQKWVFPKKCTRNYARLLILINNCACTRKRNTKYTIFFCFILATTTTTTTTTRRLEESTFLPVLNSSPFNLPSSTPARVPPPVVSSTFKPFEASLGPSSPAPNSFVLSSAEQPQKPQLGTSPQQPSFAPIILDTPVGAGGSFLDSPVGGGSPLPTVPPEVDLSTRYDFT